MTTGITTKTGHVFFCPKCEGITFNLQSDASWFLHKEIKEGCKTKYFILFDQSQTPHKYNELILGDDRSYTMYKKPNGKIRMIAYEHPVDMSLARKDHYKERPECHEEVFKA